MLSSILSLTVTQIASSSSLRRNLCLDDLLAKGYDRILPSQASISSLVRYVLESDGLCPLKR
jgi:hypothetical protein